MFSRSQSFVLVQVLAIVAFAGCSCVGRNSSSEKKKGGDVGTLVEFLVKDYDKTVRPNCDNPTEVGLDLYIVSFGKIEEVNMEFSLFVYLGQYWRDERVAGLVNQTVELEREQISNLWTPNPYCENAKKSDLMLPDSQIHSVMRISPDGTMFYSRSTSIVASCDMDLRLFPFDTQRCHLDCGSYSYTDSKIQYRWQNDYVSVVNREMAQFSVGKVSLSSNVRVYPSGNYTILTATFPFQRHLGYYLIQVYVPCLFLVMLSWIVFWMNPGDGASRLTVGITTILTIVFLLGYTNSMLPKVSYVKGMDWYVMVSFLFIFLSLVECIVVDRMWRMDERRCNRENAPNNLTKDPNHRRGPGSLRLSPGALIYRTKRNGNKQVTDEDELASELCMNTMEEGQSNGPRHKPPKEAWDKRKSCDPTVCCFLCVARMNLSAKIDRCSRLLFPISFVLFNIVYWLALTRGIEFDGTD